MKRAITRREFLQGIMAGSAGLAMAGILPACSPAPTTATTAGAMESAVGETSAMEDSVTNGEPSFLTAPEPIAEDQIAETIQADVVIIGGGIAGMCTAASCFENGLSVAVVEKGEVVRCFGLDFGCVNSSLAKEYGVKEYSDDDIYRLTRRWVSESGGTTRPDFVLSFLNNSGAAVDWIAEKAKKWGCTPVVAAYSSNSDTYENIKGIVEFHDGPAWDFASESFGARDVINALIDELDKGGYPVTFNMMAKQLIPGEDGSVKSVICENEDGEYIKYEAAKAVVLATGDFAGDVEMLNYYTSWNYDSYGPEAMLNYSSGKGDGHKMAMWVGGQMHEKQPIMFLPFTYPYFYLHVNKNGERFMNEDSNSVGMSVGQLTQPNGIAYSIWDKDRRLVRGFPVFSCCHVIGRRLHREGQVERIEINRRAEPCNWKETVKNGEIAD